MAKRRSQVDNIWTTNPDVALDGMFRSLGQQAAHDLGRSDISVGSDNSQLIIGLPLPALSLRYLFQSTVFPLGRIIQITGAEGSCKTAFALDIIRWHFENGGGGAMCENEGKDSPDLRHSLWEWNQNWINRFQFAPTYVLEEWMDVLSTYLRLGASYLLDPNGPGCTIPIAFLVDSIMSTLPQQIMDKIKREGHPSLGYPVAARLIADYMRSMPGWLQNFPFTIIGTNHLKVGSDAMGRPTYNVPGGASVKFMETYEIQMAKMPSPDIDILDYGGIRVRLKTEKNSLGPSRKQIVAELLWWMEDDGNGGLRQATKWDWYTASVDLILAFNVDKKGTFGFNIANKKTIFQRLMEICHIVVVSKSQRLAKCRALGFDDPVSYREIGMALERHPEILREMYPVLGIIDRPIFQPGQDYQVRLRQMAAEAAAHDTPTVGTEIPVESLDPQGTTAPAISTGPGLVSFSLGGPAAEILARAQSARRGEEDE